MRRYALPIIAATVWISVSEFVRNQVLLFQFWTDHYSSLGLEFPSEPINGAIWGLWSLLLAVLIYVLLTQFSIKHTVVITWGAAFLLMWVVIGNMSVLPLGILWFAVPLSLLEVYIAAVIIRKLRYS